MIVGAGLSGMIAAFVFPREEIVEARDRSWVEHQAVLRFRSDAVSDLTGIPFRRVTVHKGIWTDNGWTEPTIAACNMYASKTLGTVSDRSVWDISTVDRWIAPPDFRERLCDLLGARIHWETKMDFTRGAVTRKEPIISTIPMPVLVPLLTMDKPAFSYAPITTLKMRLPGVDVFQTVYFTSRLHSLYRASITGDMLICEWAGDNAGKNDTFAAAGQVASAFGMPEIMDRLIDGELEPHTQQFGKIAPIDEATRRWIVLNLTKQYGIYSLGRFATWRNLLLDDVAHDAAVIKRLVTAPDDYERALGARRT